MTPAKWYEDIWISFIVTPLYWRFGFVPETMWRQALVHLGPLTVCVGWPEIKS